MAKRVKNPPLFARAKTGRLIPCPGEAHTNPYIDNCGLCAPRWGLVEELEPKLSLERAVELTAAGYDVASSDLNDEAYKTLYAARVKFTERTDKTGYGAVNYYVLRITKEATR